MPLQCESHRVASLTHRSRLACSILLWSLACGVLAWLSLYLSRRGGGVASLWFANAVAIASLLQRPLAEWPGRLLALGLAIALANLLMGSSWLQALCFVPANLLEIGVAVYLFQRHVQAGGWSDNPSSLLRCFLACGVLPGLFGASAGALVLLANDIGPLAKVWSTWYVSSLVGAMTVLPFFLHLRFAGAPFLLAEVVSRPTLAWLFACLSFQVLVQLKMPYPLVALLAPLVIAAAYLPFGSMAFVVAICAITQSLLMGLGAMPLPPLTAEWQLLLVYATLALTFIVPLILASATRQNSLRQMALVRAEAAAHASNLLLEQHQQLLDEASRLALLGAWEESVDGQYHWSRALFTLLDQTDKTPPGWEQLLPRFEPESTALLQQALLEARTQQRPWDIELTYLGQGGRRVQLRHIGQGRKGTDGVYRLWGVVQDITAQRELDELKNHFVSATSHELRTPLTALHGALEMLAYTQANALPAQAADLLEIARLNSRRLTQLIQTILDFEKIRLGKLEVQLTSVDMRAMTLAVVHELKPYAAGFEVRFEVEGGDVPVFVRADAGRVMQIMTNLLSNAAKFSLQHGVVSIALHEDASDVYWRVGNGGEPISVEMQQRLFQPFNQGDRRDGRQHYGTGLGLSISQAMAHAMQGEIACTSDTENGTVFTLRLPRPEMEKA